ncbi:hypothetical protein, partial [Nostoc sp. 106C]|uniref:hypothetical protein n=1 Tax=Nostoc sp. 106C TaxID=1932667 RepID=UPI001AA0F0D6
GRHNPHHDELTRYTQSSCFPNSSAKNTETVVSPLDWVMTIPKLHIASTTACDLDRCGIFSMTVLVHCLNSSFFPSCIFPPTP